MKKSLLYYYAMFMVFFSCNNDNFEDGITDTDLVTFNIHASLSEEIGNASPQNVTITLTNTSTGYVFETTTNSNGIAVFDNIDAGNYTASANLTWTDEEFQNNLGYAPNSETITFNGALENINVSANEVSTNITLITGMIGDLLIKQVYYAGSHLVFGASFRDQFVEIYNNSNETIYADGLIFAQVYGSVSTTIYSYTTENGQFDWAQSVSNTVGETANTDYVYADYVYRIPGNGTEYPILAGESIVLATTAVNHKAPLVDNDGLPLSVLNPELTVDLSTADFEGYLGDYRISIGETVESYDIQNLDVPDLEVVYLKSGRDMIFNTIGADSFIIFRDENVDNLLRYEHPKETDSEYYLQIPIDNIIDAVETNNGDATNLYPRRMPLSLDAGYTYVPNNSFSSQSIIRKVASEINGRKILLDTNNSTNDFTYLTQAQPKVFAE